MRKRAFIQDGMLLPGMVALSACGGRRRAGRDPGNNPPGPKGGPGRRPDRP